MDNEFWLNVTQGLFLLLVAPLVSGLLKTVRAGLQGRMRGWGNMIQPYRDLIKLFKKPAVRPQTASWLFACVPCLLFVIYGLLAFMVPVFSTHAPVSADLILVIYLLGLARFTLSLAGLDTGAPFGGLGGGREMFFHFLTEIGLILVLVALALQWNTVNLDMLYIEHAEIGFGLLTSPALLLLAPAFAGLILFETGRIPVDNQDTHLELTMAQKAITLEYAGRDLALIEWAEMSKLAFLLAVFVKLFLPFPLLALFGETRVFASTDFLLKIVLVVIGLALWETGRPKLRLRKVVGPALVSMVFSVLSIVYLTAFSGG